MDQSPRNRRSVINSQGIRTDGCIRKTHVPVSGSKESSIVLRVEDLMHIPKRN